MTAKARETGENTHKMAIIILIIGSMGFAGIEYQITKLLYIPGLVYVELQRELLGSFE